MLKEYTAKVKKNGQILNVSYVCENQKEFLLYLKNNGYRRVRPEFNKIYFVKMLTI